LFALVIVGANGAAVTVKVNVCVAFGVTPLAAVIVIVCSPNAVLPAIVMTPVDALNVTPVGWPLIDNVGSGLPVAVTVNEPPIPAVTLVLFALVIAGAVPVTFIVKFCVAFGSIPLSAVIVNVCAPTLSVFGMLMTPVAALNVTPVGSPLIDNVGSGFPSAVTVNEPVSPCTTLTLFALVIVGANGAAVTVKVNVCVAFGVTPLAAVIVIVCSPVAVLPAIVMTPVDALNVTPVGWPLIDNVGAGLPVVVTVNDPPVPATALVLFALVIVGAVPVTFIVKVCVASGSIPLSAVIVNVCAPTLSVSGMLMTPVAALNVTPVGSPLIDNVGSGFPSAVTVNDPV